MFSKQISMAEPFYKGHFFKFLNIKGNIHPSQFQLPKLDIKRAKSVDTSIPLIVVETKEGLLIVDGYHRLLKAREKGLTYLPVKYITREMLETTRVKNQ